ncbi:MAG TPA: PHB depolymerase family esterase [Longimicrobiales bacterium]|nr:PHB depolymerase family esterase [Longimicrobiales bacterium]
MSGRRRVVTTVLVLISLPMMAAIIGAVSFYSHAGTTHSFESSGLKREYVLYVPRTYNSSKAAPLVISLHAAGLWHAAQMEMSGWNDLADKRGFIVVYPSAVQTGISVWNVNEDPGPAGDVRFIAELIDSLKLKYNVDSTRIYANGMSNGGGMSFVLSCALSDRIAAVGLVGSAQTLRWDWCRDTKPVPVIAIHGTADPVVPYGGGRSWISPRNFPGIVGWMKSWAQRNGCDVQAKSSVVTNDVVKHAYPHCRNDAEVVLYEVKGGGHTWPGGEPLPEWFVGKTSTSIDATREMWDFFSAHPLNHD